MPRAFDPLARFFAESSRCTTRMALAAAVAGTMRRAFNVHVGAVVLMDSAAQLDQTFLFGVRDRDLEEYNCHWRADDPVLSAVLERRTPIHARQLHSPDTWRRLPLIENYGRRIEVEPYMSGPIYGTAGIAGVLNFCRRPRDRPFGDDELRLATALCGFLSCALAGLPRYAEALPLPLTVRERQIARLAAQGQNNLEIAVRLGVARETVKQTLRRVYVKLDVRGRAAMAARLASCGWL